MNTVQLLDMAKRMHGLTDYAFAKQVGLTPTTIYGWRAGRSSMSDETGLQVALMCELDAGQVLAWLHAERSKSHQAKKAWNKIAKRLGQVALLLILISYGAYESAPVQAQLLPDDLTVLYIIRTTLLVLLTTWVGLVLHRLSGKPYK